MLLDLYCGVGGFKLAFSGIFDNVLSIDNDISCKKTYDINFSGRSMTLRDISQLYHNCEWSSADQRYITISAGFPCQPFSMAGKRLGLKDPKGGAILDLLRIVRATKARSFLFENVKGLLSDNNGLTFKSIIKCFEDEKYFIKHILMNSTKHANIPQNRERLFIVGFRNKEECEKFTFPGEIKLTTKFRDFLDKRPPKRYYYNNKPLYNRLINYVTSKDYVYQWRRYYVRANRSGVIPTLTANMGTGGHNVPIILDDYGIRKLTPLECFRLQGFPKSFKMPENLSDSKLYKQAGNSITVPLVRRIALNMDKVLNDST